MTHGRARSSCDVRFAGNRRMDSGRASHQCEHYARGANRIANVGPAVDESGHTYCGHGKGSAAIHGPNVPRERAQLNYHILRASLSRNESRSPGLCEPMTQNVSTPDNRRQRFRRRSGAAELEKAAPTPRTPAATCSPPRASEVYREVYEEGLQIPIMKLFHAQIAGGAVGGERLLG